ncbi:Aste57867_18759 [Aphanomyces stellatus]|uniref:Aste57867_18759 protein n=1 Tax=Aphanomyces stellatus TaxID=120398 RepID=A0A485LCU4_9STRA|nr:hypothetical protein As57867_018695 [Aphanomyces stellatus]VFT95493.1 Aste57867_18759 [Aphanomyces stellatus]
MLGTKWTFPLPANFFQCPPLTGDETKRYITAGETVSLREVRNSQLDGGPIQWTQHSNDKGIEIFSGVDPKAPAGVLTWCGVTEMPGTIDEVAAVFKSESTDAYRAYCRVFAKDAMDAINLYAVASATQSQPHRSINIKWLVQQSPIPAVVKHRDWCFLESCHEFEMDGVRGWVQAYKSLSLPCCPDLQATFGVVRAMHHLSGFVFTEARPGHIRVVSTWQLNVKGSVPKWIINRGIKIRCLALRDLDTRLRETRLRQIMPSLLPTHQLVPPGERSRCFLCHKRFGVFGTKFNCRSCGEVLCRKCSQRWKQADVELCLCVACSIVTVKMPTSSTSSRSRSTSGGGADETNQAVDNQPATILPILEDDSDDGNDDDQDASMAATAGDTEGLELLPDGWELQYTQGKRDHEIQYTPGRRGPRTWSRHDG